MKVEMRATSSIIPYDENPRDNDDAVDAVARSIKEFGFRQPIVVDQKGVVIVGDTRLKAAIKLGLAKVPVHVARGLTKAKLKAYRLADNKTGELAGWDKKLLTQELMMLQEMDVNLSILGFDDQDLNKLLGRTEGETAEDPEDEAEEDSEALPSHIKMVQLFFNTENHKRFMKAVETLVERWDSGTVTDAVEKAVLDASSQN